MKIKLQVIVAALMVVLGGGCTGEAPTKSLSDQMIGRWKLTRLAGQPVAQSQLREWDIQFRKGGVWTYQGSLSGTYAGMRVSGSGRWSIRQRTLTYSAGDARGSSRVELSGRQLTLFPDPVLTNPPQQQPVESVYERLDQ